MLRAAGELLTAVPIPLSIASDSRLIVHLHRLELLWRAFSWVPKLPPLPPSRYQDKTSKSALNKHASDDDTATDRVGDGSTVMDALTEGESKDDGESRSRGSVISSVGSFSPKRMLSKLKSALSMSRLTGRGSVAGEGSPVAGSGSERKEADGDGTARSTPRSRPLSQRSTVVPVDTTADNAVPRQITSRTASARSLQGFHSARSGASTGSARRIQTIVDNALSTEDGQDAHTEHRNSSVEKTPVDATTVTASDAVASARPPSARPSSTARTSGSVRVSQTALPSSLPPESNSATGPRRSLASQPPLPPQITGRRSTASQREGARGSVSSAPLQTPAPPTIKFSVVDVDVDEDSSVFASMTVPVLVSDNTVAQAASTHVPFVALASHDASQADSDTPAVFNATSTVTEKRKPRTGGMPQRDKNAKRRGGPVSAAAANSQQSVSGDVDLTSASGVQLPGSLSMDDVEQDVVSVHSENLSALEPASVPRLQLSGDEQGLVVINSRSQDDDSEEEEEDDDPVWTRYSDGEVTWYYNNITHNTSPDRPVGYKTPRDERQVGTGAGAATSKLETAPSFVIPVVAPDGLTGLSAELMHSPERLRARVGSSKLLTAAMIESRPLAEVRQALSPDRKPVVGVTPMKEQEPVAVSRMHRMAARTIGGHQFAHVVSRSNLQEHVQATALHDDHFWFVEQQKRMEEFQKQQRLKRAQSAMDAANAKAKSFVIPTRASAAAVSQATTVSDEGDAGDTIDNIDIVE